MHRLFHHFAALFAGLILSLAVPSAALTAQSEEVSNIRPAEYMIYQYPNVSLLVKVDAPETEFHVQITGPEKALIKDSGVPERRIGPIFQVVDPTDIPRQLMIKVTPGRKIDRSLISMELVQMSQSDRNHRSLGQAYKLFAHGVERIHDKASTTWAMKAYSLKNAAQAFASLGMEEMSLWSEYYAGHIILHQLNDTQTATEFADSLFSSARRAGFEMLEMAALVLGSEARMQAAAASSGQRAQDRYESLHGILERRAELAAQLNLKSEQGRALFDDGIAYERQGDLDSAIRRYEQALDATVSADNLELANEIRATAAVTYESQGSTEGAIEMLDDISGNLAGSADDESVRELADNLFEKGRLLNSSFQYREASIELEKALDLQKESAQSRYRGPTGLELSWSLYSLGHTDRAAALIEESLPRTARAGNGDTLFRAYDSMARIKRNNGQYFQMEQYRQQQASLAGSGKRKAQHLLARAMDVQSRDGLASTESQRILQQAEQAARQSSDPITEHRSIMWACLSRLEKNGSSACSADDVRSSYETLRNSGIPRFSVESGFLQARILQRAGRSRDALNAISGLLDEMRFYQSSIPGVLGAWYWENRTAVFNEYLAISVSMSSAGAGQFADGRQVLLALERVRMLEDTDNMQLQSQQTAFDQSADLRASLARLEASSGPEAEMLAKQLNKQIEGRLQDYAQNKQSLDSDNLTSLLEGLTAQDSILTYYFAEKSVYLVFANRKGVRMHRLSSAHQIRNRVKAVRETMGLAGADASLALLDALGASLLGPVTGQLTSRIWFLPSGPLNGFPVDALRLKGRYLAQNHQLVNLASLTAVEQGSPQMRAEFRKRIFLGGNPQSNQQLFSYSLSSTAEIDVVRDRFVGPGLHIVQGVALQRDEFLDERFANAALVHLAIPGSIDLAFPERSRLALSVGGNSEIRDYLLPADLSMLDVSADLVVLSGTAMTGQGKSSFDSHLGFVSEFLGAGARSVAVALWPLEDADSAAFMQSFYDRLESDPDVAAALSGARLDRLNSASETNFHSWAGFQLYIR
jgi:CHAT domain-containing protein